MAAAETTETFNCSVEDFFKIISDYESYPKFIPEVENATVIKDEGNRKLVEFEVTMVKKVKYKLWLTADAPNKVTWYLDSGDVFKEQTGHWILSDDGGKTKADYSLEASFGMFVPKMFSQKIIETNLPNMMSAYRKRVTELHG